jgi:hypothetical protein
MKMNQVYKPKSLLRKELYRTFITIYYYLLFNDKPEDYYKKILKYFFNENAKLYYNFFYNNFYNYQNIFFFTLYNQLPIEFLPLPNTKLYLNYPLITFSANIWDELENNPSSTIPDQNYKLKKIYIEEPRINLNKSFISKNIFSTRDVWKEKTIKDMGNDIANKKLSELRSDIKEDNHNLYDDFQILLNINFIKKLPNSYLKNKIIFLFVNKPYIITKYNFNFKKDRLYIYEFYVKNSSNKYDKIKDYSNNYKYFNFKDIKFLSLYKIINNNDIIKSFNMNKLNKGTILYHQINTNCTEINNIPSYFTLDSSIRILDPLYIRKNNSYNIYKYKTTKDINILDIASNIYTNNEIININYDKNNLFFCYDLSNENYKFCDYNFINPNDKISEINYNNKFGLSLIIWKNKKYIDYKTSLKYFLKMLDINSYFNIMSLIRIKDNGIKLLGNEFYIGEKNAFIMLNQ